MLQGLIRFGKPETPYFLGFPALPGKFFFKSSRRHGKLFLLFAGACRPVRPALPGVAENTQQKALRKAGPAFVCGLGLVGAKSKTLLSKIKIL